MRLGRINVTIGTFGSRLASREEREKISFPAQRTSLFGVAERKSRVTESNEARRGFPWGLGEGENSWKQLTGERKQKVRNPSQKAL